MDEYGKESINPLRLRTNEGEWRVAQKIRILTLDFFCDKYFFMIPDFSKYKVKDIPCPMRFVQGGTMDIGESENKHCVTIPSFYIGQYQVTQEFYEAIMESNPSDYKGKNHPVTDVNWYEAKTFIQELKKISGKKFRLPSESEWEFAARGGMDSQGYQYCGSDNLEQVGWYYKNSGETKSVGLLLPNELGIYDMSGNVWEWCEDIYNENFKVTSENEKPQIDGHRVVRGGGYYCVIEECWSRHRDDNSPDDSYGSIGFRLVLTSVPKISPRTEQGS